MTDERFQYRIHDRSQARYGAPLEFYTDDEAKRFFHTLLNGGDKGMSEYPKDFSLYRTAVVTGGGRHTNGFEDPEIVINGLTLLEEGTPGFPVSQMEERPEEFGQILEDIRLAQEAANKNGGIR